MQKLYQLASVDRSLFEEAQRLRKEARGTPPGVEREKLLRKARMAESASHYRTVSQDSKSPGSRLGP